MLHMIKLAVNCESPEELKRRMDLSRNAVGNAYVPTWLMPKRADELIGGSIFRVMNGLILCRQPIVGFETYQRPDGRAGTHILVSEDVVAVQPTPRKAFQGWRYLQAKDAPRDLTSEEAASGAERLPPHLLHRLAELGIL